ncbi:hypothetical protein EZS27_007592 [termite gut metagenome]|uniref:O-methyltransferase n=1 Tax=termite gut metagenome TaxID=433724 RepID=A0A5J4SHL0_9ZZZZ
MFGINMDIVFLTLQRPFIWLIRFCYRFMYNVHSPFAFNLITQVIYEKKPYYAYREVKIEERKQVRLRGKGWIHESKKINRLLFRLVNMAQPDTIVDVGTLSSSSLYLQAGKLSADYVSASDLTELFLEKDVAIDFLYLHNDKNPALVEDVFQVCAGRIHQQSVFVIEGICYSKQMKNLWKRMIADDRVGVTFNLYYAGILFFDKTKVKQHYKVCF